MWQFIDITGFIVELILLTKFLIDMHSRCRHKTVRHTTPTIPPSDVLQYKRVDGISFAEVFAGEKQSIVYRARALGIVPYECAADKFNSFEHFINNAHLTKEYIY